MNKKLITLSVIFTSLALPFVVLGLNHPDFYPGGDLDTGIIIDKIFNFIWPIFGAIAILMFIFAGFLFLTAQGDPTKISSAKKALMWGIIGTAVALLSSSIPFIINRIF